ncbi:MAG: Holliday junction branch migration protein RuvA [Dehalococcoidia bacterium]|jgi:Holliday junction DNA helicase RuvA
MISNLRGRIESISAEYAIIGVNGVGFLVFMPTSALTTIGIPGNEVKVFTHLHLREDNVSLYGFTSAEELWLFETLIGVTGLGPRLALAMLSAMNSEQLTTAIATGSSEMLETIPGIGKKVANRIILELKDKIGSGWIATPAMEIARGNTDVLAALTSLGYSAAEATKAIANLPVTEESSLEDRIKTALQYLGNK